MSQAAASDRSSDIPLPASDEELLVRYRDENDVAAFEELVHRFERELYNYLYRYLGDAHAAEEVFQATFLQLHQKRHLFQADRRLRPWIYNMATNLAIDFLRRSGRHQAVSLDAPTGGDEVDANRLIDLLVSEAATPPVELEEKEREAWIRQAVEELPEHLRVVVLLVFFQGMKYSEVAETLEIPIGTVKSRLHSAIARLSEAWNRRVTAEESADNER